MTNCESHSEKFRFFSSYFSYFCFVQNSLLKHINYPKDLRQLSEDKLPQLAQDLREFIINIVATKEGHLGASLGVVELTIALHYVFNTPEDLLIWDVGHQAYGHKILTGRKDIFETNRQLGGISGFPKRSESEYDTFGVGHSSTSISAALGMAIASQLYGEDKHHVAIIGDASIASGMAFEGLNHAGVTDANLLVILNDNAIGIDPSVGALKQYLTNVKKGTQKQDNIFEALNFDYSGPIDGHDLTALISELQRLKTVKGPKFLHVITTKGKGLKQAEENQVKYHAPGKFDAKTGELIPKSGSSLPPKFQDVFGETIVELAQENEKIIGITPAMPTGSSLKYMMEAIPKRAFDVGIAEQHAVTLAAGMATQGLIPFCNIYSTFLQRAYDQVIHDVALQNLPVVFCLDRSGLVGEDGATHHGVFDLACLRCIPNMVIFAPRNAIDLRNIMYTVQLGIDFPIAIRYPRGRDVITDWKLPFKNIEIGKGICLNEGENIAILSIGSTSTIVTNVLSSNEKYKTIGHYDMRFVKPLDEDLLNILFNKYKVIISIEDGTIVGGFGSAILEFANTMNYKSKVEIMGVMDAFTEHGKVNELKNSNGFDESGLQKKLDELILSI
ncbi:MAG: 1-deoxy-D-xylulose-5-phosphate synthase [Winogradskyella sp.]|nr:MAG: 1-deoxy-D-xylulose-5-phosphate synthase [Winogradskyella sp.]